MSDQIVRVSVDLSEVKRYFADWKQKIPVVWKTALRRMGEEIVGMIQTKYLTGQVLHIRTGRLRKSIDYKFKGNDTILVGTNVEYGAIHEFGGTIRPKNAGALAIPLSPEARKTLGGPTRMAGLFMLKGSNVFLAGRGAGGLVMHYLLLKSVTIPKRPYISPAIALYASSGAPDRAAKWAVKKCIDKWVKISGGA